MGKCTSCVQQDKSAHQEFQTSKSGRANVSSAVFAPSNLHGGERDAGVGVFSEHFPSIFRGVIFPRLWISAPPPTGHERHLSGCLLVAFQGLDGNEIKTDSQVRAPSPPLLCEICQANWSFLISADDSLTCNG